MGGGRVQFNAVGILKADYVSGKFHNRKLHAQAKAQERDLVFPGISDGMDHAVDAPVAKTAGHQDALYITEGFFHIFQRDGFRIDPFDVDVGPVGHPGVL